MEDTPPIIRFTPGKLWKLIHFPFINLGSVIDLDASPCCWEAALNRAGGGADLSLWSWPGDKMRISHPRAPPSPDRHVLAPPRGEGCQAGAPRLQQALQRMLKWLVHAQ